MNLKRKTVLITSLFALTPFLVHATDVFDIIDELFDLLNAVIPVILGLAVLFFLWGAMSFILKTDNAEARSQARSRMFWGIIIIFVMVSLWGFVNLLDETLGLDNDAPEFELLET